MANMNDFELNINSTNGAATATTEDYNSLLSAVIGATSEDPATTITESTDPTPKPNEVTVTVPSKTEISADVYNQALSQLQRSFKEGADILEMLQGVTPAEEKTMTLDEIQDAYTEAAIDAAFFESCVNGPYFEAASNKNKAEIKRAAKAIMDNATTPRADKYGLKIFRLNADPKHPDLTADNVASTATSGGIVGIALGSMKSGIMMGLGGLAGAASSAIGLVGITALQRSVIEKLLLNRLRTDKTVKTRLWQMVGSFMAKEDELETALEYYSKHFASSLEQGDTELKLGAIELHATYSTSEKNFDGNCYILIVDDDGDTSDEIEIEVNDSELKVKEASATKPTKKPAEEPADKK